MARSWPGPPSRPARAQADPRSPSLGLRGLRGRPPRRTPGRVDERGSTAEICDHCGAVVDDETALYSLAPDSSKVHPTNPRLDGKRLVVACSAEHLAKLHAEYDVRPWIDEELWAGKIHRALEAAGGELKPDRLSAATGLTAEQLQRAVAWHNEQIAKRSTGRPEGPS